jgi:hypothetical protein
VAGLQTSSRADLFVLPCGDRGAVAGRGEMVSSDKLRFPKRPRKEGGAGQSPGPGKNSVEEGKVPVLSLLLDHGPGGWVPCHLSPYQSPPSSVTASTSGALHYSRHIFPSNTSHKKATRPGVTSTHL